MLTVKSAGKNEKSAGAGVAVDFLAIKPELVMEGEQMKVLAESDCEAKSIPARWDFSDGAQLSIKNAKVGSTATLGFSVRKAGKYPVSVVLAKAVDHGQTVLSIDERRLGALAGFIEDNPFLRPDVCELVKLGEMDLTAGSHQLTIEVTGKNEKSKGYRAGLDVFRLK